MTETDTKEVEFSFGDISVGESLEPEQLETKESEDSTEETSEEISDETTEESSEESAKDSSEESNEEPSEELSEDSTEESSEELSTEDILGDPLEEKEENSDGRNYEGFDDEDKQYAKQMSNNAYEHFSKKLKELKSKKDAAEETQDLMSHPEAYTLNPEYQELVTDYDKASQEQAHWKRQLVAIRNGDSWRSIEGYDKNGKLVLGKEEYKPTGESEIDVQSALTEAQTLSKSYGKRAHDIQKNHTKDYKESTDMLEEEQRNQFKWLQDKDMGKKVIDIPNLGKTSINKLRKTFGEAIPKVFTNHPMSELATNLWVMNQILAKQQHELTQKIKKQNTNKKDMLRGEPKATTSGVEDDDMISIGDDMAEYFS